MILRCLWILLLSTAIVRSAAQPDLIVWGPALNAHIVTRTFATNSCEVSEGCIAAGTRRLLVFDTQIRNISDVNLVIGSPIGNPLFEFASCHGHYHFRDFADNRLTDAAREEVAAGLKIGFCLLDSRRWNPSAPSSPVFNCDFQGLQAGWADVYDATLPCQWIDITSLAGGVYMLEVEVNPEQRLAEATYTNNTTRVLAVVDGPCTDAPANDAFGAAQTVDGRVVTVIGSNSCATRQTGEPSHASRTVTRSLWYRWVPDYTGQATLTTFGSTLNTVLAVYRGTAVNALSAVVANDDSAAGIQWSRVTFSVTNGVPQMIAVDGVGGASGGVALNINPAGNDRFTNCLQITGLTGNSTLVNAGATNEPAEPPHGVRSVWYCWTAPSNTVMRFHTHGSSIDTRLAVYQGSTLTNLSTVASNDDAGGRKSSAVLVNATAGATYFIAVGGSDEGLVSLAWEEAAIPRFAAIDPQAAGVYELLIAGKASDRYLIQHSMNLQQWQDVGIVTNLTGLAGFVDEGSGMSGFYRAVLLP